MGAAPSRETHSRGLYFVDQSSVLAWSKKQQIVLIPLTKEFFPSPDCPLFVQFHKVRCDAAVNYYFRRPGNPGDLSRIPNYAQSYLPNNTAFPTSDGLHTCEDVCATHETRSRKTNKTTLSMQEASLDHAHRPHHGSKQSSSTSWPCGDVGRRSRAADAPSSTDEPCAPRTGRGKEFECSDNADADGKASEAAQASLAYQKLHKDVHEEGRRWAGHEYDFVLSHEDQSSYPSREALYRGVIERVEESLFDTDAEMCAAYAQSQQTASSASPSSRKKILPVLCAVAFCLNPRKLPASSMARLPASFLAQTVGLPTHSTTITLSDYAGSIPNASQPAAPFGSHHSRSRSGSNVHTSNVNTNMSSHTTSNHAHSNAHTNGATDGGSSSSRLHVNSDAASRNRIDDDSHAATEDGATMGGSVCGSGGADTPSCTQIQLDNSIYAFGAVLNVIGCFGFVSMEEDVARWSRACNEAAAARDVHDHATFAQTNTHTDANDSNKTRPNDSDGAARASLRASSLHRAGRSPCADEEMNVSHDHRACSPAHSQAGGYAVPSTAPTHYRNNPYSFESSRTSSFAGSPSAEATMTAGGGGSVFLTGMQTRRVLSGLDGYGGGVSQGSFALSEAGVGCSAGAGSETAMHHACNSAMYEHWAGLAPPVAAPLAAMVYLTKSAGEQNLGRITYVAAATYYQQLLRAGVIQRFTGGGTGAAAVSGAMSAPHWTHLPPHMTNATIPMPATTTGGVGVGPMNYYSVPSSHSTHATCASPTPFPMTTPTGVSAGVMHPIPTHSPTLYGGGVGYSGNMTYSPTSQHGSTSAAAMHGSSVTMTGVGESGRGLVAPVPPPPQYPVDASHAVSHAGIFASPVSPLPISQFPGTCAPTAPMTASAAAAATLPTHVPSAFPPHTLPPMETFSFSSLMTNIPILSFLYEMKCRWGYLSVLRHASTPTLPPVHQRHRSSSSVSSSTRNMPHDGVLAAAAAAGREGCVLVASEEACEAPPRRMAEDASASSWAGLTTPTLYVPPPLYAPSRMFVSAHNDNNKNSSMTHGYPMDDANHSPNSHTNVQYEGIYHDAHGASRADSLANCSVSRHDGAFDAHMDYTDATRVLAPTPHCHPSHHRSMGGLAMINECPGQSATDEMEMWITIDTMLHGRVCKDLAERLCWSLAERPTVMQQDIGSLPSIDAGYWRFRGLVDRYHPPPLPTREVMAAQESKAMKHSSNYIHTGNNSTSSSNSDTQPTEGDADALDWSKDVYVMGSDVIYGFDEGDILRFDGVRGVWCADSTIPLEGVVLAAMRPFCRNAREAAPDDAGWVTTLVHVDACEEEESSEPDRHVHHDRRAGEGSGGGEKDREEKEEVRHGFTRSEDGHASGDGVVVPHSHRMSGAQAIVETAMCDSALPTPPPTPEQAARMRRDPSLRLVHERVGNFYVYRFEVNGTVYYHGTSPDFANPNKRSRVQMGEGKGRTGAKLLQSSMPLAASTTAMTTHSALPDQKAARALNTDAEEQVCPVDETEAAVKEDNKEEEEEDKNTETAAGSVTSGNKPTGAGSSASAAAAEKPRIAKPYSIASALFSLLPMHHTTTRRTPHVADTASVSAAHTAASSSALTTTTATTATTICNETTLAAAPRLDDPTSPLNASQSNRPDAPSYLTSRVTSAALQSARRLVQSVYGYAYGAASPETTRTPAAHTTPAAAAKSLLPLPGPYRSDAFVTRRGPSHSRVSSSSSSYQRPPLPPTSTLLSPSAAAAASATATGSSIVTTHTPYSNHVHSAITNHHAAHTQMTSTGSHSNGTITVSVKTNGVTPAAADSRKKLAMTTGATYPVFAAAPPPPHRSYPPPPPPPLHECATSRAYYPASHYAAREPSLPNNSNNNNSLLTPQKASRLRTGSGAMHVDASPPVLPSSSALPKQPDPPRYDMCAAAQTGAIVPEQGLPSSVTQEDV